MNYAPIEELVDQYRPKMSDFYVSGHIPLSMVVAGVQGWGADAISQFIIWTYEQNPEVNREEVLEAFGKAITVDSVVEKVNDPVLHISVGNLSLTRRRIIISPSWPIRVNLHFPFRLA